MVLASAPSEDKHGSSHKDAAGGPRCKFCHGHSLVKWGKRRGHQRYKCKECSHTFDDNGCLPRDQTPVEVIGIALDLYYGGFSLRKVVEFLRIHHGIKRAFRTVLHWIQKYVSIVEAWIRTLKPQLQGTYHADETVIFLHHGTPVPLDEKGRKKRRRGLRHYFWDCIDKGTRYIVGYHFTRGRSKNDAKAFLRKCRDHGGKPQTVVTDGLESYKAGVRWGLGIHPRKHAFGKGIKGRLNQQKIERWHGSLKDRLKPCRGLKSLQTAVLGGYVIWYNFLRPHQSLGGQTPASKAGIGTAADGGWMRLLLQGIIHRTATGSPYG